MWFAAGEHDTDSILGPTHAGLMSCFHLFIHLLPRHYDDWQLPCRLIPHPLHITDNVATMTSTHLIYPQNHNNLDAIPLSTCHNTQGEFSKCLFIAM